MSWQEYNSHEDFSADRETREQRHARFDRETRNFNLIVGGIMLFIASIVMYGIYDDYQKAKTLTTLSSQLEECQLKLQPK